MPASEWTILERADGEPMIRYQGEAVNYQETTAALLSALWGAASVCSPGPEQTGRQPMGWSTDI